MRIWIDGPVNWRAFVQQYQQYTVWLEQNVCDQNFQFSRVDQGQPQRSQPHDVRKKERSWQRYGGGTKESGMMKFFKGEQTK